MYGTSSAPLQGKSFRKAVSAVMDDLELFNSIIEQLTPKFVANNLRSKLALLQLVPNKIVNCVSAFASTSLRRGKSIGWVLFAEYRTARLCALSSSLIDECCSVSLLVSCFAAAKLHI